MQSIHFSVELESLNGGMGDVYLISDDADLLFCPLLESAIFFSSFLTNNSQILWLGDLASGCLSHKCGMLIHQKRTSTFWPVNSPKHVMRPYQVISTTWRYIVLGVDYSGFSILNVSWCFKPLIWTLIPEMFYDLPWYHLILPNK